MKNALLLVLWFATPAGAAVNGPFAFPGFQAAEPVVQQKARWQAVKNRKDATYRGCKYSEKEGEAPVVIDASEGCSQPICVASLVCQDPKILDTFGNPLLLHVRCLAKNGRCPKDPADCGVAGNVSTKREGVLAISHADQYFDLPWENAKEGADDTGAVGAQ